MHADRLRDAQKARPFHPYVVTMTDGRRFQVRHPEFVILHPDNRTVVLVDEETGETHLLDRMLMMDLVRNPLTDPQMSPQTAAD